MAHRLILMCRGRHPDGDQQGATRPSMDQFGKTPLSSLSESSERLQVALRNHAVGIFETDPASGSVYWSDELQRMFGYEPGQFDGQLSTWRSHAIPEDLTRLDQAFAEAIASKATSLRYSYRIRRCDGEVRHIEASVQIYYDDAGNQTKRVGVNVDVTERVAQELRLRTLFDQMHEGFIAAELIYDKAHRAIDFRFLDVNGPIEQLTGLRRSDMLGQRAYALIPGLETFWLKTYAQVVETGEPATFEHHAAPLGRWFHVHAYRYSATCFAALFLDISGRIKSEEEARKSQRASLRTSRLTAMGALASTLAHELNQPLTAAANYLATIKVALASNPELNSGIVQEAAEGALMANLRAGQIINRIRAFTLEGYVEKNVVDLGLIIEAAANETLSEPLGIGLLIHINLHEQSPLIHGDNIQLEQVFSNLFRNSALAMKDQQEPREIMVDSKCDGVCVEVTVRDTGTGISINQLPHIFEPFASNKQGLGLGLPICRTIVEAHGGSISATSTVGQGAEFTVRLPCRPAVLS